MISVKNTIAMLLSTNYDFPQIIDDAQAKISELSFLAGSRVRAGSKRNIYRDLKAVKELHEGIEILSNDVSSDDDKSTAASWMIKVGKLDDMANQVVDPNERYEESVNVLPVTSGLVADLDPQDTLAYDYDGVGAIRGLMNSSRYPSRS